MSSIAASFQCASTVLIPVSSRRGYSQFHIVHQCPTGSALQYALKFDNRSSLIYVLFIVYYRLDMYMDI